MNIHSNTPLKAIKDEIFEHFGVAITTAQAKEIKESCLAGVAMWSDESYISTCDSDDIRLISADGVEYRFA